MWQEHSGASAFCCCEPGRAAQQGAATHRACLMLLAWPAEGAAFTSRGGFVGTSGAEGTVPVTTTTPNGVSGMAAGRQHTLV